MSCSSEFGTVLPTRATPTTTLMNLFIIVVKFFIDIISANEENAKLQTTDIVKAIVKLIFKLRLICPV